ERRQLVDHRVEGGLELKDLTARVHVDLARQVALGDRGGDLGDVPDLPGQVPGHRVHRLGEVLPRPGDAGHVRLPAELSLGADLTGDPGHFGGELVELVDHAVEHGRDLVDERITGW